MLNLISSGDLDTGKVKRYLCDTLADFAEIPVVAAGSTVLVQTTGEIYKIDVEGNWKYDCSIGTGGEGGGSINPNEVIKIIENYFNTTTPAALDTRLNSIETSIQMQTIGTL